ncbi:MAG: sugar phosphate isomerase/epimerase [Bacillota bacterium]
MTVYCSTSIKTTLPLDEALGVIASLGFKEIDLLAILAWAHVNPAEMVSDFSGAISRVESLLKKHSLSMRAMNTGTNQQLHDRSPEGVAARNLEVDALCRFMKHFGVKVAAIQPLQKDPTRPWQEVIDDCVLTLKEQFAIGETHGIQFGLEMHANSPIETLEQAEYLLSKMPDIPLVYDPTHFVMLGMGVKDSAFLMDNAIHCHLRDAGFGKMQTHMGEGDVDFALLFSELKKRNYKGNFTIEYLDSNDLNILEDVKILRQTILDGFIC